MLNMTPGTTIIFDFTTKSIITAGSSPEADRRFQDFMVRQQLTAVGSSRGTQA